MHMLHRISILRTPLATLAALLTTAGIAGATAEQEAEQILKETGIAGGLVVHLGAGDGRLTAALRVSDSYQVQGLASDDQDVIRARAAIQEQGVYGPVSIRKLQSKTLPFIDNMVNLVVADQGLGDIPMAEVLRVLAPHGVAYIQQDDGWQKTIKPRPDDIDEWTHYLHDAGGNAVAHDDRVGPPEHLQWVGGPRWSRHHDRMASMSALVTAGGRIFYIMDEGSRISIQMPSRWTLIARDAFNGTLLWKRKLDDWNNHLWPLKSGPTQLARRLVTDGKTVFITMGIRAPLVAIDAATGETLRTYPETKAVEEVIHTGKTLFVLANEHPGELAEYSPKLNLGDQARVDKAYQWDEEIRKLVAIEAESGKVLWTKQQRVAPLSLASEGNRLVLHDGEKVVCLDSQTGKQVWQSISAERRPRITFNFGPRLLIHDGIVLFAGGDKQMRAYDIKSGEALWIAPHAQSGYKSPEDLMVAGGLVWVAPTTTTKDTGVFTGRDPRTGEVKVEFPPNVETYWFHHRCYIAKATDKFLMPSRTGIEFVDVTKKSWDINHWVRGGCLYGVMPANGLTYAPPHNCACYPEAKLYGMNALASSSMQTARDKPRSTKVRLSPGPAYDAQITGQAARGDWPTYRGNNARSGSTTAAVAARLKTAWETELGGRLSPVTAADGRIYLARVDAHQIVALSSETGETLWTFTAGGRIDSPPTWWQGRLLFGSADGNVYCLRASDGALAWRFAAAPSDLQLASFEQLECVWPVHGSVLVRDGEAWFAAGRSIFLDGGLQLYRLDAKTGKPLAQHAINDRDPETGGDIQDRLQVLNMPVGLTDILASQGDQVFMRSQRFDLQGNRLDVGPNSGDPLQQAAVQQGEAAHLFAPMGFLDDSYFHRAYWVYGRSYAGGHSGYSKAGKFAPAGRLLVNDDQLVYGYGRKPQYYQWTTTMEHQLFASDLQPELVKPANDPAVRRGKQKRDVGKQHPEYQWTQDIPLVARAMVKAGDTLFVLGPPDLIDEEETFKKLSVRDKEVFARLAEQDEAFDGKHGGILLAISTADGSTLAEHRLKSLPVWDGMSATQGGLVISTIDGKVICFRGE